MTRPTIKIIRKRRKKFRIGIPDGARAVKAGFPAGESDEDIIMRAIWNHYGTKRIPPRPFILLAVRRNRIKYRKFLKKGARCILRGETDFKTLLTLLGVMLQDDIRFEIRELKTPPNAPSTIRRKKSSNPLIDTGQMRQSVTFQVEA